MSVKGGLGQYSSGRFYVPKSLINQSGELKTIKYIDESTGKVLIKGKIDGDFAGEEVSVLMVKKGADMTTENAVGYVNQYTLNNDGSYAFTFYFSGNVNEYEVKMYLGDETVTDTITEATASHSWLDTSVSLLKDKESFVNSLVFINNYVNIDGLTYFMVLAFYDDENNLISITPGTVKTISTDTILLDSIDAQIPKGAVKVKSLVWTNYTQMVPLCEMQELTLSN